jgi:glucokinase
MSANKQTNGKGSIMDKSTISKLTKSTNFSLVLEMIRSEQPISRAAVTKKLGLSRSAVSAIVDELLQKKIVVEMGLGSSTKEGGRRGIELGFNPKSAFGIGVDIGGTKILIVITDWDGDIIFKERFSTVSDVIEITNLIKQCIQKSGVDERLIIAMGIGVPAITDTAKGEVIDAPALGWRFVPLRQQMQEHFDFPVFVNNDVRCAALGERWLGSGGNSSNIVFIAFGTGIGSAIISNGQLIEGHNFSSGEIGYFIDKEDVDNGFWNKTGQFGTFENKNSGTGLSKHGYTSKQLFEQYEKSDPAAKAIIHKFILEVSIAIANICSLLNPEKIILGGGVSDSMKLVIDEIKKNVLRFTPNHPDIELAVLGTDAGGLGAIAYAFNKIQQ